MSESPAPACGTAPFFAALTQLVGRTLSPPVWRPSAPGAEATAPGADGPDQTVVVTLLHGCIDAIGLLRSRIDELEQEASTEAEAKARRLAELASEAAAFTEYARLNESRFLLQQARVSSLEMCAREPEADEIGPAETDRAAAALAVLAANLPSAAPARATAPEPVQPIAERTIEDPVPSPAARVDEPPTVTVAAAQTPTPLTPAPPPLEPWWELPAERPAAVETPVSALPPARPIGHLGVETLPAGDMAAAEVLHRLARSNELVARHRSRLNELHRRFTRGQEGDLLRPVDAGPTVPSGDRSFFAAA